MSTRDGAIEAIARMGDVTQEQAARVYEIYRNAKILKVRPNGGWTVTHGAYLDKSSIQHVARGIA